MGVVVDVKTMRCELVGDERAAVTMCRSETMKRQLLVAMAVVAADWRAVRAVVAAEFAEV